MLPNDVYALTSLGQAQLRSKSTTLSAAELDLLVRFDGVLNLGEVLQKLPSEAVLSVVRTVLGLPQDTDLRAWSEHAPR